MNNTRQSIYFLGTEIEMVKCTASKSECIHASIISNLTLRMLTSLGFHSSHLNNSKNNSAYFIEDSAKQSALLWGLSSESLFAYLFFTGDKDHDTVSAGSGRLSAQERTKLLQWGEVCTGAHLSSVYTPALPGLCAKQGQHVDLLVRTQEGQEKQRRASAKMSWLGILGRRQQANLQTQT